MLGVHIYSETQCMILSQLFFLSGLVESSENTCLKFLKFVSQFPVVVAVKSGDEWPQAFAPFFTYLLLLRISH